MAEVLLAAVSKVYPGGARAVETLDLAIGHGEFVVLVGPSGCGKSTTLRMIAGLEDATSGELSIDGRVVNEVAPKDRDVAMVFQNYALYPHLSVRGNLSFPLEQRRHHGGILSRFTAAGRSERASIDARVDAVAQTLGITPLLNRKPAQLSGGQRQRVAVGRAMVRDPKVFLFDEPLSNLDAKLRGEMRTELRILHKRLGATMIYVTHDQEEAMSLADRIVVMHSGRLQQAGSPIDVYQRPVNRFVASFIGTPTMNFIPGRVAIDTGTHSRSAERGAAGAATSAGVFRHAGGTLALPGNRWRDITAISGRDLVLGIRPDQLRIAGDAEAMKIAQKGDHPPDPNSSIICGVIAAAEHYGDRMDIVLDSPSGRFTARCPPVRVREGDPCTMIADLSAAHLFEVGECGAAIALS
ncbi:MAG: ATP-binding cassette domain-containing protein [Phycisphaerales bacterium]|nr:ATP-binding cassette domain-containing protein [Phycisphaerales bacterium]